MSYDAVMSSLLEILHSGRMLLMDGPMGTELQRAGIRHGECYEQWNLTHPDQVRTIHRAYVDAGAECLQTNTFQANPQALARHGLEGQFRQIIQAGITLARAAAGSERLVLASVGPGEKTDRTLAQSLAEAFASIDALLLETFSDWGFLQEILKVGKPLPVLLSFTFLRTPAGELQTHRGHTPEACARAARQHGIAALGVNCGRDIGMDDVIEILRRYRAVTALPLFARPNAGTPTRAGDRWVYPRTPRDMAARLPEFLDAGAVMVGGCCGTTPDHIAAFRDAMAARV
jgi:methionine synthase I (cobalamin-dependent)